MSRDSCHHRLLMILSKSLRVVLILAICVMVLPGCSMIYDFPPRSSNSECPLQIKNYLGNTQNIHPKVLYFQNGWQGYRFWMAYTPYPNGKTSAENPCIAVSDDGLRWSVPHGLTNPLAKARREGYNSDTHLVYDESADRLECWWREYDIKNNRDQICRRTSYDGVKWSPREVMLPYNNTYKGRLSPAVWIESEYYKMVYSSGSRLMLIQAPYGEEELHWSSPVEIPIDWKGLSAWHHDLIVGSDGIWELVVCAFMPGGNNNTADLYYVELSPDFSYVSEPELILGRGVGPNDFDSRSIYRSSIVRVDDEVYLYYSSIDEKWNRFMSLLRGPSVFELHGLSFDDFL